jgi:hypothetical protein
MTFDQDGASTALPRMIEAELLASDPPVRAEISAHIVYQTRSMAERCLALVEQESPDVVLLWLPGSVFAEQSVSFSIYRRARPLYRLLRPAIEAGRSAGGGGIEGTSGLRGLLYRLPRAIARLLFGRATFIPEDVALASTITCLRTLASRRPLVVRLAHAYARDEAQLPAIVEKVAAYNATVRAECDKLGVPCFDPEHEVTGLGVAYRMLPDRLHPDETTRRILGRVAASYLGKAAERFEGGVRRDV